LEALKKQIQSEKADDAVDDIENEDEEVGRLNLALEKAANGLRTVDVILNGDSSDDLPLDERFESIRERIQVLLDIDRPAIEMNRRERQLREKIEAMRRRK
jgi:hypothetical protein